jgi:hypothetical protein
VVANHGRRLVGMRFGASRCNRHGRRRPVFMHLQLGAGQCISRARV